MHLILYCSKSRIPESSFTSEFWQLTAEAAKRNRQLSVTGMLIFHDGWFIQALEGNKQVVLDLLQSIERDPRHEQFQLLIDGEIHARSFDKWSLGALNLNETVTIEPELLNEFSRIYQMMQSVDSKELLDMMGAFLENSNSVERLVG